MGEAPPYRQLQIALTRRYTTGIIELTYMAMSFAVRDLCLGSVAK